MCEPPDQIYYVGLYLNLRFGSGETPDADGSQMVGLELPMCFLLGGTILLLVL